jgi:hypothetical protein
MKVCRLHARGRHATFLEHDNRALHPCRMQQSPDRDHTFVLQYLRRFRISSGFPYLPVSPSAVASSSSYECCAALMTSTTGSQLLLQCVYSHLAERQLCTQLH